jgi:hypothetical protein
MAAQEMQDIVQTPPALMACLGKILLIRKEALLKHPR